MINLQTEKQSLVHKFRNIFSQPRVAPSKLHQIKSYTSGKDALVSYLKSLLLACEPQEFNAVFEWSMACFKEFTAEIQDSLIGDFETQRKIEDVRQLMEQVKLETKAVVEPEIEPLDLSNIGKKLLLLQYLGLLDALTNAVGSDVASRKVSRVLGDLFGISSDGVRSLLRNFHPQSTNNSKYDIRNEKNFEALLRNLEKLDLPTQLAKAEEEYTTLLRK